VIKSILQRALGSYEYLKLSYLLKRNEVLRDKHLGERAFLFATGTSMLEVDLPRFNGEVTIGCNEIFRHSSFPSFDLKYYVVGVPFRRWRQLGPRFTHEDHHQYFLNVDKAFCGRDTEHFYHATMHKYLEQRGLLSGISRYYFLRKSSLLEVDEQVIDLTRPGTFYDGGLTMMIALAMFMGCKEIYLFGCGYTYSPVQAFHFYNCMRCPSGGTEAEMEARLASFRLSHPESGGWDSKDTNVIELNDKELLVDYSYYRNTNEGEMDDFYLTHRIIKAFSESCGARIFNVTPSGYDSPVYEKIDLDTVLRVNELIK
jgi:hypothetical protein